jgi:hypothetical protein
MYLGPFDHEPMTRANGHSDESRRVLRTFWHNRRDLEFQGNMVPRVSHACRQVPKGTLDSTAGRDLNHMPGNVRRPT